MPGGESLPDVSRQYPSESSAHPLRKMPSPTKLKSKNHDELNTYLQTMIEAYNNLEKKYKKCCHRGGKRKTKKRSLSKRRKTRHYRK